jgi:drug/metabolite transporter (DMT)-like permease
LIFNLRFIRNPDGGNNDTSAPSQIFPGLTTEHPSKYWRNSMTGEDQTNSIRSNSVAFDLFKSGVFWGLLAVLAFSLTVPLRRVAAPIFGGVIAGLGRAALAALVAGPVLVATSQPRPNVRDLPILIAAGLGLLVGYPLFLSLGLESVPSIHGAITSGLLPVATAVAATALAGERPPVMFWISAVAGVLVVLTFAVTQGGGRLVVGDAWLLCAVVSAGAGNCAGGLVARRIGGWQTICWALLVVSPITMGAVLQEANRFAIHAPFTAWISLLYLGIVSSLLAFCAWVKGLSLGGIARIGQLQLLHPFIILTFSAILLGEQITLANLMTAGIVFICAVYCLSLPISKVTTRS